MTRVSEVIRQQVRERAKACCEYCGIAETIVHFPHQVDHIIPPRHGGTNEFDNLAWACFRCNNFKGTDIATVDFESDERVFLYHPRNQVWSEHFEILASGEIHGKTTLGRATARLLQMNIVQRVEMRRMLLEADLWNAP